MMKADNPRLGILFLVAGMAFIVAMDGTAKWLTQSLEPLMVVWARYVSQALIVLAICAPRLRQIVVARYPRLQFLRSVLMLAGTILFFFALAQLDFADAMAVFEINPLLIAAGAALFLGERFGLKRVLAVFAALIGALIILRPGTQVLTLSALLPLATALCYAGYVLTTRFVGKDEQAMTSLFYTTLVGAIVMSAAIPWFFVQATTWQWVGLGAMGAFGTCGHFAIIRAFSLAPASLIAPFSYTGLVLATLIGMAFFHEYPDRWDYLGMIVIVGAGLYVWWREGQQEARTDDDHVKTSR